MFSWISANLGTIIICAVLIAIVVFVIVKMRKGKKKGSSCNGGCDSCQLAGKCHPHK